MGSFSALAAMRRTLLGLIGDLAGGGARADGPTGCENGGMKREEAHQHIAAQLAEWFPRERWSAERVAEIDQRLAIDDADKGDPVDHLADFALRVLDRARLIEPYAGPGAYR